MVEVRSLASVGLRVARVGRMETPLHEVRMRVFCGLRIPPYFFAMVVNSVKKNFASGSGTKAEPSSMKPSRLVMPPSPSSPMSPFLFLSAALAWSFGFNSVKISCRTMQASVELRGHPWLNPSSMRRSLHVPSCHLYLTVPAVP